MPVEHGVTSEIELKSVCPWCGFSRSAPHARRLLRRTCCGSDYLVVEVAQLRHKSAHAARSRCGGVGIQKLPRRMTEPCQGYPRYGVTQQRSNGE